MAKIVPLSRTPAQVDEHHEQDRDDGELDADARRAAGKAEVIAATPAATLTDTVRT